MTALMVPPPGHDGVTTGLRLTRTELAPARPGIGMPRRPGDFRPGSSPGCPLARCDYQWWPAVDPDQLGMSVHLAGKRNICASCPQRGRGGASARLELEVILHRLGRHEATPAIPESTVRISCAALIIRVSVPGSRRMSARSISV